MTKHLTKLYFILMSLSVVKPDEITVSFSDAKVYDNKEYYEYVFMLISSIQRRLGYARIHGTQNISLDQMYTLAERHSACGSFGYLRGWGL